MKTRDIFTLLLSFIITVMFHGIALAQSDTIQENQQEKILGVGLRFSNPEGLSIKSYHQNKAIEFLVGRDNPWRSKYYYYRTYNQFRHIDAHGWYEHKRPWSFHLRYLVSHDISLFRGLSWYYGIGAHIKTGKYYYHSTIKEGNSEIHIRDKQQYLAAGVDIIAGLEYVFPKFPIALFYDIAVYVEAFRNPLFMQYNNGLGIRYMFE